MFKELIPIVALLSVFGSPALIVWIVLHFRFRTKQLAAAAGSDPKQLEKLREEKRELETRIQNLETIVCSVDYELSQRINHLLSQPSVALPALPSAAQNPALSESTAPASSVPSEPSTARAATAHESNGAKQATVRPPSTSPSDSATTSLFHARTERVTYMGQLSVGMVVLNRYRIEREIGRGGMGAVYLADDSKLNERVALKVIASLMTMQPDQLSSRFHREVQAARRVTHPNVIRIHDIGEDGPLLFLSMEYIEGETLESLVRRRGALAVEEATRILRSICAGLTAAHAVGVIHRDLKPQNVLVSERGDVKIIDFGLATNSLQPGMTATGIILGTPDFMAPEQVRGQACDERTDVYALSALAHYAFTGSALFTGDSPIAVAFAHAHTKPPRLRDLRAEVPSKIDEMVARGLSKDPAKRPKTVSEWSRCLA